MRCRLAPTSMTLDALERPKRPARRNKIVLRSAPEKNVSGKMSADDSTC